MSTPVRASDRDLRALAAIVSQDRARPAGRGGAAAVPAGRPDGPDPLRRAVVGQLGQRAADVLVQPEHPVRRRRHRFRAHRSGVLGELLGLPALQLRCPHRRPAQRHQGRGLLLGPAMAQHGHVHRSRPAAGPGALSHGVPAQSAAANRRARAVCAADPLPRARAGLLRAGPGGAHAAGPAPGPGLPGRAAAPSPGAPAHPPADATCCACWPPGTPTPRSPAAWASPREPCAPTWKTSTNGCSVSSRTAAVTRAFPDRVA